MVESVSIKFGQPDLLSEEENPLQIKNILKIFNIVVVEFTVL